MSSDLQPILELVVLNNYATLGIITAVVYDYALTLSGEVNYVWCRPWTPVSTLFVVVRYFGICWAIIGGLIGSSFIPGPQDVGSVLFVLYTWVFVVLLSATDLVMILRVYAMWHRSKMVLYFLLFIYALQTITIAVVDGIYDNPNTYYPVTVVQVAEYSFCNASNAFPSFITAFIIGPRLTLAAALLFLAVFQTIKQSIEMYKETKQWQPSSYMKRLVSEGILYFLVNVLCQVYDGLSSVLAPSNDTALFLDTLVYISFYNLIARFVVSIRELHDLRGRSHIDIGFGVLPRPNVSQDTTVPGAVAAAITQDPEVEHDPTNSGNLEIECSDRV